MRFLAKKPTRGCCSKGPCSKNAINFCCWHLWIFTRTEIWRRLVWLIYTYASNSLLLFTVLRIRNRVIHKWRHHFSPWLFNPSLGHSLVRAEGDLVPLNFWGEKREPLYDYVIYGWAPNCSCLLVYFKLPNNHSSHLLSFEENLSKWWIISLFNYFPRNVLLLKRLPNQWSAIISSR